jgi:hypothetical protein
MRVQFDRAKSLYSSIKSREMQNQTAQILHTSTSKTCRGASKRIEKIRAFRVLFRLRMRWKIAALAGKRTFVHMRGNYYVCRGKCMRFAENVEFLTTNVEGMTKHQAGGNVQRMFVAFEFSRFYS